jgi:methyltransferase
MDLSVGMFLLLLAAVGLGRLIEMRLSRRHQRALRGRGIARVAEPQFRWMVALHTGVLVGAALEVLAARRPFYPALAAPALALVTLAVLLRFWVIATMGPHWNVQVMGSTHLGVVTSGPFRWIRHPNYVAVFVELLALPLVHTAWITALLGSALHVLVLRRRIALEETVLLADPGYRAAMAGKPRFLPRLWARPRRPPQAKQPGAWPTS